MDRSEITTSDERAVRLAKRQALLDAGQQAYGHRFDQSSHAAELAERYVDLEPGAHTDDVVSVAGRIMAVRDQGKVCFMVLRDQSGDIQLFCRINDLGDEAWERIKELDVGDIVGVTGTVMRTRRGELSISPTEITLLTKSCRPYPEKFHGLSDKETRYRQRYVDLTVNPEVKDTFIKRSEIISTIRRFMEDRGFIEVETPILHSVASGANAKPFATHYNALDMDCYLRIAPELHLKRLLVGGFERVFEINRCFRNEGMDLKHNPEFTTMEVYQAYSDLDGMKELCCSLVKACNAQVNGSSTITYGDMCVHLDGDWPSRPMTELVSDACGQTVTMDTPPETMRELCREAGIEPEPDWGVGKMVFEIYDKQVEHTLIDPIFVVDFPIEISPLARKKEEDPRLTERFELVIAGCEYANAFGELADPVDQEERFRAQAEAKAHGDDEAMAYDRDFVRALEYGMPPAGGVGIGIDRLVMLLTDSASIRDVLLFPHMRPESD